MWILKYILYVYGLRSISVDELSRYRHSNNLSLHLKLYHVSPQFPLFWQRSLAVVLYIKSFAGKGSPIHSLPLQELSVFLYHGWALLLNTARHWTHNFFLCWDFFLCFVSFVSLWKKCLNLESLFKILARNHRAIFSGCVDRPSSLVIKYGYELWVSRFICGYGKICYSCKCIYLCYKYINI